MKLNISILTSVRTVVNNKRTLQRNCTACVAHPMTKTSEFLQIFVCVLIAQAKLSKHLGMCSLNILGEDVNKCIFST